MSTYICTQMNLRIIEYVKIYCRIGTFNKHCSLDISTMTLRNSIGSYFSFGN